MPEATERRRPSTEIDERGHIRVLLPEQGVNAKLNRDEASELWASLGHLLNELPEEEKA